MLEVLGKTPNRVYLLTVLSIILAIILIFAVIFNLRTQRKIQIACKVHIAGQNYRIITEDGIPGKNSISKISYIKLFSGKREISISRNKISYVNRNQLIISNENENVSHSIEKADHMEITIMEYLLLGRLQKYL
jgi:hypothetical protein